MAKKAKHDEMGGRIIGNYNNYHPVGYGLGDKQEVALNTDDLNTVLTMSINSLRKGVSKYPNDAAGLELFKNTAIGYFEYINQANERENVEVRVFPDVEGLCIYCGITRKTLCEYAKRNEEWAETIDIVKTAIASAKKQLANSFKMPPVLAIFDLANNHDYKNVSEFKITAEASKEERVVAPAIPDLERKYIVDMQEGIE